MFSIWDCWQCYVWEDELLLQENCTRGHSDVPLAAYARDMFDRELVSLQIGG